ncbi:RNA helicase [Scheffersomyces spartinae]|uniref:ATP-dependent RNA helicase SUV3, mitochondrial n=1 Tax=Scheffersomyces spartinae TaxID=45513 RepID=A0A9P7V6J7_9ASCO|nr:RNA helicase [Scheffersomyces spartinae]KAG7192309.1 RNA helicase [Scheffersomyces spartinae]
MTIKSVDEAIHSRSGYSDHLKQLQNVANTSIEFLRDEIIKGKLGAPYEAMQMFNDNHKKLDHMLNQFTERLDQTFKEYLSKTATTRPISEMKPQDFINPLLVNIPQIIYCINNNLVPQELLLVYPEVKTKQDFLTVVLRKLLFKFVVRSVNKFTPLKYEMNMQTPASWYPEARKMKRKIIMHVGPTNSGKTYNSLQKLATLTSGYYAGPLRLLAREIFERFNKRGIKCNLITGEEIVPSVDEFGKVSDISSSTIEMVPMHKHMDMCIIDEIQMISDPLRGQAWTNALLGVLAKEVHLCGEESAVPLVKKICQATGDEIEVRKYQRLGKLEVMAEAIRPYEDLQKGDCVIAFSKRKILETKLKIESKTKLRVGVIYGALPPEIRSQMADGFNNGQYDVLVALDAIGMGLNLKINRVIFSSVKKFDGTEMRELTPSQTKQIAGRAGRYSSEKGELTGYVSAFSFKDLRFIKRQMKVANIKLEKACIWPPDNLWLHYMMQFEKPISFHEVLTRFQSESIKYNEDYFLAELEPRLNILRVAEKGNLQKILSMEEQLRLSLAPMNGILFNDEENELVKVFHKLLECVALKNTVNVFDLGYLKPDLIKNSPKKLASSDSVILTLQLLEQSHRVTLVFLWLSQRWPTIFVDKESAMDMKVLLEKRITEELLNLKIVKKSTRKPDRR